MANDTRFTELRTQLLLDHPFFGALSMHLTPESTTKLKTLRTDGRTLWYNPQYLDSLPDGEALACIAHEVMHPAMGHPFRRGGRELARWNEACDHAINTLLQDAGFTLPAGVLCDPKYRGLAAEQVYSALVAEEDEQQGGQSAPQAGAGTGQGQGTPELGEAEQGDCPTGDFVDAPQGQEGTAEGTDTVEGTTDIEKQWQVAVEQARLTAVRAGHLPGSVDGELVKARQARVHWTEELREFVQHVLPSDYAWTSPNRRFVGNGIYLPGTIKENQGVFVIAVDTSGSTSRMRKQFADELGGILREATPERVYVVYCDATVQHVDEMDHGDFDIDLKSVGNGGTSFEPPFRWVAEQGIEPDGMVYLTDLEGSFRFEEPSYPVLWASPDYCRGNAPWGRNVKIPVEGRG